MSDQCPCLRICLSQRLLSTGRPTGPLTACILFVGSCKMEMGAHRPHWDSTKIPRILPHSRREGKAQATCAEGHTRTSTFALHPGLVHRVGAMQHCLVVNQETPRNNGTWGRIPITFLLAPHIATRMGWGGVESRGTGQIENLGGVPQPQPSAEAAWPACLPDEA